jgi:hypothetical protein
VLNSSSFDSYLLGKKEGGETKIKQERKRERVENKIKIK